MTDSSPSPFSTPKRKRADITLEDGPSPVTTQFCFDVNAAGLMPSSGGSSPRTKVAHRFRGLALADRSVHSGGGGVAAARDPVLRARAEDADNDSDAGATDRMQIDEDESKMRKRTRLSPVPDVNTGSQQSALQVEIPETPDMRRSEPQSATHPTTDQPRSAPAHDDAPLEPDPVQRFAVDQTLLTSSPKPSPAKLSRPTPANKHPVEALKTKGRKRAGTPPLSGSTKVNAARPPTDTEAADIVDPVRAALTWHEDEITVYDPEDEDDDGIGINGIGFKPTPAIAYARAMKRRQQLAEYKKREEKEARARRSHRRRGSPERSVAPKLKRKDKDDRKVRFTETENATMIETI